MSGVPAVNSNLLTLVAASVFVPSTYRLISRKGDRTSQVLCVQHGRVCTVQSAIQDTVKVTGNCHQSHIMPGTQGNDGQRSSMSTKQVTGNS